PNRRLRAGEAGTVSPLCFRRRICFKSAPHRPSSQRRVSPLCARLEAGDSHLRSDQTLSGGARSRIGGSSSPLLDAKNSATRPPNLGSYSSSVKPTLRVTCHFTSVLSSI